MARDRKATMALLRMIAPAGFVAYGVYLLSHSVIVAAVVGAGVFILCRFLLGLYAQEGDEERP